MKTSNKILLGAFLTAMLILLSVQVALYAKYKRGEYTLITDGMWPVSFSTYSLDKVKYVSVNNMVNVTIQSSDSAKLQYEPIDKEDKHPLSFVRNGDTLTVSVKDNNNQNTGWNKQVALFVNSSLPVRFINSAVQYNQQNSRPAILSLDLEESSLSVFGQGSTTTFASTLNITARKNAMLNLDGMVLKKLNVLLYDSELEETNLLADSIHIATDRNSKIKLRGENLAKAIISRHE